MVTLVDAKHVTQHIEEIKPDGVVNEAVEQIAYADRIILNKICSLRGGMFVSLGDCNFSWSMNCDHFYCCSYVIFLP